ncbi:MAG TPA: hypothetical protein VF894_03325 [Anaeromyxobacter sp.]
MTKRFALVAALAFAAPALAATPKVMDDARLDSVAAGTGSLAPVTTAINVNASPITLTQTAVALSFQTADLNVSSKGHGHAWGLLKQQGFAVASNSAKINYHVVQINNVH